MTQTDKGRSERSTTISCTVCDANVNTSQKALQCDFCKLWQHQECSSINQTEYKLLQKGKSCIKWSCSICNDADEALKQSGLGPKLDKILQETSEINQRLANFETRLISLENDRQTIAELERRVKIIENKDISNRQVDADSTLKFVRESQSREKNIVLFNCSESQASDNSSRKSDDAEKILKVLNQGCEVDIHPQNLEKVIRLGRRNDDDDSPPRPLLVTLDSLGKKKEIMRNLFKLRDKHFDVRINHDMTKAERENSKKLYMEAKRRQDSDASGNWIFKIRGPPWDLKIIRVKRRETPVAAQILE